MVGGVGIGAWVCLSAGCRAVGLESILSDGDVIVMVMVWLLCVFRC